MNVSAPFISRPIATTLLTLAIALIGLVAYILLPVSPLPQVDFPTIRIQANLPGANPETMAATVATPLERTLGRIAGISEMTSQSSLGSTSIVIQFDLSRDINGAARDVQAAINAARATLPTMPTNPTYYKLNPADAPIMIIGLTSDTLPLGQVYDAASTILSQKISQIYGVGQVQVSGSSLPAIRVELEPLEINHANIALESLRATIARANVNLPKGMVNDGKTQWVVGANDQLSTPEDFSNIIIRYQNQASLRLGDVSSVVKDVQDVRNLGFANGKPAVLLVIFKQPGANIVDAVERIKDNMPLLKNWTPEGIDFTIMVDRSKSIRASLHDVVLTLIVAVILVIFVVFLFLRNSRATFIPAITIPVSLLGTFGVMYLLGYSLNHLSLMALTIATGFVVDDAIVVTENIVRHIENGVSTFKAAFLGSKEVAFTVTSISISLVAIFIPILGMGGMLGRLFKEFAVTLSTAVLVSLVISLTTTPMLCAILLRKKPISAKAKPPSSPAAVSYLHHTAHAIKNGYIRGMNAWTNFLDALHEGYARTLHIVLQHKFIALLTLLATIGFNVYLYIIVPKGFFPPQDTGQLMGMVQADQGISFTSMRPKMMQLAEIVRSHEAVAEVGGFAGGRQLNSGFMFISLKPRAQRKQTALEVIEELRPRLSKVAGADLRLQPMQDVGIGGRRTRAANQYTLQSDDIGALREWSVKVAERFKTIEGIVDVNSDQEIKGLQTTVMVDKNHLAQLGVTQKQVDSALGLAFGQSFASTIYSNNNQYRVVMEFDKPYLAGPEALSYLYVPTSGQGVPSAGATTAASRGISGNSGTTLGSASSNSTLVPLLSFSQVLQTLAPVSIAHQGQKAATTVSFNLSPGYALSELQETIDKEIFDLGLPNSVIGGFQGTAKALKDSISNQPLLILAAIATLYIVLGILYESLIHPLTILSTLPSAGVGAILALLLFKTEFTVIAFIGVLLLSGIVKKNAIMMVDFAIEARRKEGLDATAAIYKACLLRFRPIMMTTMAAIFGAIPLILSFGDGSELRSPLGITIVGGLLMSQLLTLYTTPVVYLYLDRFTAENKKAQLQYRVSHPD